MHQSMKLGHARRRTTDHLPRLRGGVGEGPAPPQARDSRLGPLPSPFPQVGEGTGRARTTAVVPTLYGGECQ